MFATLSISGWIDGLTAGAIIISSLIFGILSIVKGAKNDTKLLIFAGVNAMVIGSYWLGPFVDFIYFGFFNFHINAVLYCLLSYTQVSIGVIIVAVIGGELITPNYKNAVIGAMSALGMVFFAFLYTNIWALAYNIPYLEVINPAFAGLQPWNPFIITPGTSTDLIDASFSPWNPALQLIWVFQFFQLIFMGFGFLVKSKQSMGELRTKFLLLGFAFILFFAVGITDSIFSQYDLLVTIMRCLMCTFAPLLYLGLRP